MRTKFTKECVIPDSDVPTSNPENIKPIQLYSSETLVKSAKANIDYEQVDSDKWRRKSQYKSEDECSEEENEKGKM